MIQVAQRFAGDQKVWYTGIDMFEARRDGPAPLPLKETYRILRATEANVRLRAGRAADVARLGGKRPPKHRLDIDRSGRERERSARRLVLCAADAARKRRSFLSERHEADGQLSLTASPARKSPNGRVATQRERLLDAAQVLSRTASEKAT